MPSTYSPLKIQLMATGENNTTWGDVTNLNLGTAIEEAIVGSADVTFASGDVTLTLTDTNASQTARNMRLRCTGTTGGSPRNLVVPSIEKPYIVKNDCADSVTVKTAAGTGVAVPAGKTMWVYSDGTNVVDAVTHLSSLTLSTDLSVADGGTGASTFTANGVLYGNGASALQVTAAGTTGQVLVGNTGSAPSWATLTSTAVTSISFGTTGLTPSTATQGAVTVAGTLGVANGGTGVTTSTGTGSVVLSTSPTLTTPNLGTPSAATLTNATGLPLTTGVTGTLGVANGGTGTATAFTAGSVVFAGASGVYSQDNANLFWDNTNDRLGIGTSSPSPNGRLSVNGNIVLGPLTRNQAATQSVGVWSTGDPIDDNRANIGFTTVAGGASSSSYITFATNNYGVSGGERMRIDSSGNVLIGTSSSPSVSRLYVDSTEARIQSRNSTSGANGYIGAMNPNEWRGAWAITGTPVTFGTSDVERMRLDSSGNLGIGTSAPGQTLQVVNAGNYQFRLGAGSTFNYDIGRSTSDGFLYFYGNQSGFTGYVFSGADGERMRIDSSGNLLVGTTAEDANIGGASGTGMQFSARVGFGLRSSINTDVHYWNKYPTGDLHQFRCAGSPVGSIAVTGSATTYNTSSDARLKHDIVDAPEASNLLDAIKVRSFKWNVDGSEQRYGMIAQELLEVAPEAVTTPADPDAMMGVDYSKLVPVLVKAVQELTARVAQLEGK